MIEYLKNKFFKKVHIQEYVNVRMNFKEIREFFYDNFGITTGPTIYFKFLMERQNNPDDTIKDSFNKTIEWAKENNLISYEIKK